MIKKLIFLICLIPAIASAQSNSFIVPLWAKGAPGFEKLKDVPEQAKDYWVKNINNPTLTVFLPPKDKANGTAIVVCPGGGHRLLVFTAEGIEPAKYLSDLGVAVFVLKYRLGRDTNSPYKIDIHAKEDGCRAMRLVRSRAAEWGIDPNKIGMMGFSAGGEVVDMVSFYPNSANTDVIDKQSARPNFIIQIYPGPLYIPDVVPADAPPVFLLAANDDLCCSPSVVKLLAAYRAAKVPVEAHIYTKGDHGFNMGNRSKLKSINTWPQRMADWLSDNNYLKPAGERPKKTMN
ncbi:MAG TPA: alpha/beta hydrolase [Mucilaginibacter sp.]|nr:alpha/beta hydrolase [Mucilaginibacter sp.]